MKNYGFTLVEVLIATLLVGLVIASLLVCNHSFTQASGAGVNLSTAEFLGEQIRELTVRTDYGDLHSNFDDVTYSPPKGADGEDLADFASFTQQMTVQNVSNTNFEQVVADHSSDFARITVKIFLNSKELISASWIRAEY